MLTFLLLGSAAPAGLPADPVSTAVQYVAAQEAVMEADAGSVQIDALMAYYAEDFVYYHPQFGATVRGVPAVRAGVAGHLGETRDAAIEITDLHASGDHVSISTITHFKVAASGQAVDRPGLMILTFRAGKIVQRVDI